MLITDKKSKAMTPYKFYKSLNSFQKGDIGFCAIVSISVKDDYEINNIGFWFEIIDNKAAQLVIVVQMDSFTIDKPIQSTVVAGKEQLQSYIKNVRFWAEEELISLIALQECS